MVIRGSKFPLDFGQKKWKEEDETWNNSLFGYSIQDGVVYFFMVPSIGVVYLVIKMRKWASAELWSTYKAEI